MNKKTLFLSITMFVLVSTGITAFGNDGGSGTKNRDFIPYDCYDSLNFDSADLAFDYWCADGGEIHFVQNDPLKSAYSGSGAAYVDTGDGFVSIWGGPNGFNGPQIGDTISGYFYYKKLSEPTGYPQNYQFPKIRLYSTNEEGNESNFCITENIDYQTIANAPLNEWIRVEIQSTGKPVTSENINNIEFSIEMGDSGHEFMIDNIVFGGYRSDYITYDIFKQFSFDLDITPSTWAGEGAIAEIKYNDPLYAAHSGSGTMYLNSMGAYFSLWGGHYGWSESFPQAGDITGGYFYIKKLSESSNPIPNARFYSGENLEENYFSHTDLTMNMSELPLNEWTRIDLIPTGRPSTSYDTLQFNLTPEVLGDEYLIDDITMTGLKMSYTLKDNWSQYAGTGSERFGSDAVFYNGKIYISGGLSDNSQSDIKIYNIADNTWTNSAPMTTPVYNHSSAVFRDKLYIIGGLECGSSQASNKIQVYDIATDTWSDGGTMLRSADGAELIIHSDKMYILGGGDTSDNTNSMMVKNAGSNLWYYDFSPMLMNVKGHDAKLNGIKIYVTGGENNGEAVNKLQIFDMESEGWTYGSDMPAAVTEHKVIHLQNKLYVLGGKDPNGAPSSKVQIYDIDTDTWSLGSDIPGNADIDSAAYFTGKIYVFAKDENVRIYDIASNSWTQGGKIPGGVPENAFVFNDCIYLADTQNVKAYGDLNLQISGGTPIAQTSLSVYDSPDEIKIFAEASASDFSDKKFVLTYPADKITLTDLSLFTPQKDEIPGNIRNTNVKILRIENGEIEFSIDTNIPAGKWASRIINGFSFAKGQDYQDLNFKCIMTN